MLHHSFIFLLMFSFISFLKLSSDHKFNLCTKKCVFASGCQEGPIGLESGVIKDEQITASSSYSSTYAPKLARLNGDGCWTPQYHVANPYLMVRN